MRDDFLAIPEHNHVHSLTAHELQFFAPSFSPQGEAHVQDPSNKLFDLYEKKMQYLLK
jgi:hypothetical protein